MTVRVRFAPSPTGYLHVGGARTALFNWLYARHVGGTFLLRIEDTDKQRSTDEHTQVILDGLTWLGLDWDEDLVFQGARLKRHQEVADQLLKDGKAYLDEGAIRLRMPPGEIAFDDAVHGPISFQGEDIKDFIILRADRTPLYNLAVVVDDIDMRITHVLRGDDHISNTPKQIAIYRALGATPPVFGHVPMINGPDGKKLSKRHGATAVGDYQHFGILPEALANFLALLGWSPGNDRELFFDQEELVKAFDLGGILKKSAVFDMVKLKWMNNEHMRWKALHSREELINEIITRVPDLASRQDDVGRVLPIVVARSHDTTELADQVNRRLSEFVPFYEKALEYINKNPQSLSTLREIRNSLAHAPELTWYSAQHLEPWLKDFAQTLGKKTNEVFQPIRVAVSGSTVSEPVHELLWAVGRERAVQRIDYVLMNWPNIPSTSAQVSGIPQFGEMPKGPQST